MPFDRDHRAQHVGRVERGIEESPTVGLRPPSPALSGQRRAPHEAVETQPVLVVKRSGERMAYHREKVILGVTKACEKRPVSLEQIEIIVDRVERNLARAERREVPSETIGRFVLEQLRDVDEVAYVRFASVYRSFQNIDEFFTLLNDLRAEDGSQ